MKRDKQVRPSAAEPSTETRALEPAGPNAAARSGTPPVTPEPAGGSPLRRVVTGTLWIVLLLGLIAAVVLLHRVADAIRAAPLEALVRDDAPGLDASDPGFPSRLSALTGTALEPGNEVVVLTDAALIDRMMTDLATAQRSITLMGYFCETGRLGDRIAEVLEERARDGVLVFFLGDGFGCRGLLRQISEPLREAGARVASFRPVRWFSLHRAQHRMHARTVVVDGSIGYTGGFGISDKWTEDRRDDPLWRETGARVVGPAVAAMQAAFLTGWAEATGELWLSASIFPEPTATPDGAATAGFMYSAPAIGTTAAERYLALLLQGAQQRIYIANSYFVPTPLMRGLLAHAAARGVDVRILLPNERTDIPISRYAGRSYYEELLQEGIRIYEYQPAMMHAKTMVVDGVWATLGSLNFDNRSMRLNDEAALVVSDARVGATMDSIFLDDLSRAREISLDGHRSRSIRQRMLERFSALLAPLL